MVSLFQKTLWLGAGMNNNESDAVLAQIITFLDNSATLRAAGLYNYLIDTDLSEVSFTNNHAGEHGERHVQFTTVNQY